MKTFSAAPFRLATVGLLATLLAAAAPAIAQGPPPSPLVEQRTDPMASALAAAHARWKSSLAAFANADKERLPGSDGVLFVGSSTIRLWSNLAQDFRSVPVVINRGFGGSTLADCSLFARELVVRYKPRQVLLYAGDNDLAEGQTPLQVLESFIRFEKAVRAELPHARLAYISIKPSPSRAALLEKIGRTNRLISAYIHTLPNTEYIDIYTPMLDEFGQPRGDLFLGDKLHLNETGYRLWQSIIVSHLPAPAGQPDAPLVSVNKPVESAEAVAKLPAGAATPVTAPPPSPARSPRPVP
ncbi:MAG: GDSL family lipase [Comamonadaceae bacterium]|nr:MAG: GDSL family lipase [Comamonadaceae bacterium]